jgi:hypothetical protein
MLLICMNQKLKNLNDMRNDNHAKMKECREKKSLEKNNIRSFLDNYSGEEAKGSIVVLKYTQKGGEILRSYGL